MAAFSTVARYQTRAPKLQQSIVDKAAQMRLDAKTNGEVRLTYSAGSSPDANNIVVRDWFYEESAHEWADFMKSANSHVDGDTLLSVDVVPYIADITTIENT